jgi:MFS family permease
MNPLPSPVDVLGAMITPAVLISASGTLVLSTSNRLTRVVDRVRALGAEAERLQALGGHDPAVAGAKRALIADQVPRLAERVLLLRSAMTVFYVAIGLLVATSIAVGMTAVLQWHFGWLAIASGLFGACGLFWGTLLLVREARLAVRSTLQEMDYLRAMISGNPRGW